MNPALLTLLAQIETRGIDCSLRDGDLALRGPKGALDPALVDRIRALKPALVEALGAGVRVAPATGAQRQLWFVQQLAPEGDSLHYVMSASLRGVLEDTLVAALARALDVLVDRHESLRTTFAFVDGVLLQVARPRQEPTLVHRRVPDSLGLHAALAEELRRPFALEHGPLFRAVLLSEDATATEHVLALVAHHAILDAPSARILFAELGALLRGETLAAPTMQSIDYGRERARRSHTPAFAAALERRRARLAGGEVSELPSDFPRPATPRFIGALETRAPDLDALAAVEAMQARTGATPFAVILAALNQVLARWLGRGRVLVGTPVNNRPDAAHRGLVAMCVDTVPIEGRLDDRPGFEAFVDRVREAALAAFEDAEVPLIDLVAAGAPPVTVMLNVPSFAALRLELPGLAVEVGETMPGARFDLTLYAHLRRGVGLELQAAYASDLFRPEHVAALLRQLAGVLRRTGTSSRGLAERPVEPCSASIHDGLAEIAARRPEQVVLRAGDERRTWSWLRRGWTESAERLRAAGVGPGRRVAVDGVRGPALIVHLLAVLEVGAAFVILDLKLPEAVNEARVRAAGVSARIGIDGVISRLGHGDASPPDDLAYVAFTTGTSGRPKGILGAHGPVAHFLSWYPRHIALSPEDRVSLLSGLSHDPLLRDIFPALRSGAVICIPPGEPASLGARLLPWLRDEGVSVMHLTPALGRLLLAEDVGVSALPALRIVVFAGDSLRPDDLRRWAALAPHATFFNGYGTTETPQIAALHRVDLEQDTEVVRVPVGRGVPGVELRIILDGDAQGDIGEIGEIG
ncbi:MAG: AMP-binding protein, partial [Myxococcales bacterium]|nr:AMP-binding protein [Myxococcales bacterium]